MPAARPVAQPLDRPIRLAVLISGGGTTLANLAVQIQAGTLAAEIPIVIASRSDCGGIAKAAAANIPCAIIRRKDYASLAEFSQEVFSRCRDAGVDLVICGGYLALLQIPPDYQHRVLNIHPSLIPAFCGQGYHGEKVHAAALERGVKVSGCTVHFVDDEYDHGPIVVQRTAPVLDDDTPATLAARVFAEECLAYPEAIRLFAAGRLEIENHRVRVLPVEGIAKRE